MTEDPGVLPAADAADELEQSRDAVSPGGEDRPPSEGDLWGADEADVIEQSRSVPASDEDDEPDEE